MPTLSVVMIVKNEAHCLRECLESVRGVAGEMLVGDTGSTDATTAIAAECGARVIRVEWQDDFARARNAVLAEAKGDWLLHMDADEVLDPASAETLREIIDGDGLGADAVELVLANYCDTPRAWRWLPADPDNPLTRGHSGYISVPLLRLFRNGRGYEYREPVHENITESVVEAGGVIMSAPIIIHHYGYGAQTGRSEDKAAFYLELGRRKAEERPYDPKAWHDFAEQSLACGDADTADSACRKALVLDPAHIGAATTLANILLTRGDVDGAHAILEDLEKRGLAVPHVVTALGAIACRQGRLEEARERLEGVIASAPATVMAYLYLARVLDRQGDPAAAECRLEEALGVAPRLEEPHARLRAHRLRMEGERLFVGGESARALNALVQSMQLDPDDPMTHNDLGVVLHALGEHDKARLSFDRALLLAPGMPEAEQNIKASAQGDIQG